MALADACASAAVVPVVLATSPRPATAKAVQSSACSVSPLTARKAVKDATPAKPKAEAAALIGKLFKNLVVPLPLISLPAD